MVFMCAEVCGGVKGSTLLMTHMAMTSIVNAHTHTCIHGHTWTHHACNKTQGAVLCLLFLCVIIGQRWSTLVLFMYVVHLDDDRPHDGPPHDNASGGVGGGWRVAYHDEKLHGGVCACVFCILNTPLLLVAVVQCLCPSEIV